MQEQDALCPAGVVSSACCWCDGTLAARHSLLRPVGEAALASMCVTNVHGATFLFVLQHNLSGNSDWDEDECRVHHAQSLQPEVCQDPTVQ